jgi:hypothetical protein
MSDADLEAKFHGQADEVLGTQRVQALIDACWGVGAAADVCSVVERGRA